LKYKQCCGQKEGKTSPMLITAAVLVGGLIIAGAIFVSQNRTEQAAEAAPAAPAAPSAAAPQPNGVPGSPQPPGPVPPGKVWNVEHGHWHDVSAPAPAGATGQPGAAQPAAAQPAQPAFTPGPQPPGPVPAGKVWSTEHGHWHDAPK
jgi:2-oxoglutarate dehydrogenase E1 component